MTWEELLEDFRSLGGIAENVRLGTGPLGRGIFTVDPAKPARLYTPENLLVPADSIAVVNGQMTTTSTTIGSRERAFFERYERYFGWGAGGFEESYEQQAQWHALAPEIVEAIKALTFEGRHPDRRFVAADEHSALHVFLNARIFTYDDRPQVVPMIDLINHSSKMGPYHFDNGVTVSGTFDGEMLVSYNSSDSWGHMLSYGFPSDSLAAYSVPISVALPMGRSLAIARAVGATGERNRLKLPKLHAAGTQLHLSFLMLGYTAAMDLPRAVFRKVMTFADVGDADRVFDGIAHFNRTRFIDLLRKLRKYDRPLVRLLEEATLNQLDALSACIGSRNI